MIYFKHKYGGIVMKVVAIDGQGGKMGGMIVRKIKEERPDVKVYAVGTNSTATAAMLKAGADFCATGENPVVRNAMDADIIIGPIGIISANSILGEVTPKMAEAVGSSGAKKILIPVNGCNILVAGVQDRPVSAYIADAVSAVCAMCE